MVHNALKYELGIRERKKKQNQTKKMIGEGEKGGRGGGGIFGLSASTFIGYSKMI